MKLKLTCGHSAVIALLVVSGWNAAMTDAQRAAAKESATKLVHESIMRERFEPLEATLQPPPNPDPRPLSELPMDGSDSAGL